MEYSVEFLRRMKGSKQPCSLYHPTRGRHFENYPSDRWAGASRARTVYSHCMVEMDHVRRVHRSASPPARPGRSGHGTRSPAIS
jgi:hypothetical protein